jgi:putative aldouronate transport system permease protein
MKVIQSTQSGNEAHSNYGKSLTEIMAQVSPESIKMAITIIVTVPILVIYPFLQKYFVQGVTLGAVKS